MAVDPAPTRRTWGPARALPGLPDLRLRSVGFGGFGTAQTPSHFDRQPRRRGWPNSGSCMHAGGKIRFISSLVMLVLRLDRFAIGDAEDRAISGLSGQDAEMGPP